MMLKNILMVAVGGSIGAVTRYLISLWAVARIGADFPYGTLIANVVGCFIIGVFMTITMEKFIVSSHMRLLVTVGFLGGLTTFSSFSYETFKVFGDAGFNIAMYNVLANIVLGFLATWGGILLGKMIAM
ncbi:fluoride efflux transporter CrcB [Dendrosporobacter sp. 1207_IL3150]|uniref:fluoride efflux transporter CrcB n=1 Tax=Dendrosporobacter sp. 1207_IL3150 TaxID=3084054 RepID=UPI002FD9BA5A